MCFCEDHVRRKGMKYTRGQAITCPRCGHETKETKELSMSSKSWFRALINYDKLRRLIGISVDNCENPDYPMFTTIICLGHNPRSHNTRNRSRNDASWRGVCNSTRKISYWWRQSEIADASLGRTRRHLAWAGAHHPERPSTLYLWSNPCPDWAIFRHVFPANFCLHCSPYMKTLKKNGGSSEVPHPSSVFLNHFCPFRVDFGHMRTAAETDVRGKQF